MSTQEIIFDPRHFNCNSARVVAIAAIVGSTLEPEACLVEFESDKAVFEISMPTAGSVHAIHVEIGEVVTIAMVVATIQVSGTDNVSILAQPGEDRLSQLKAVYPSISGLGDYGDAVQQLNQNLELRPTVSGDLAAMVRIWGRSLAMALNDEQFEVEVDESQSEWFLRQIKDTHKHFTTARLLGENHDDQIIGFCNVELIERTPQTFFAIVGLYVRNPVSSWTPGPSLLSHMITFCKQRGVRQILAFTHPKNAPAIRLLVSQGFRESGMLESDPDPNRHRLIFEFSLFEQEIHI